MSGTMKTPMARSSVIISVYRYASASRQTNDETAPVVPTNGMWPTCIVCMPITNEWVRAPSTNVTVATRPAGSLRRAK